MIHMDRRRFLQSSLATVTATVAGGYSVPQALLGQAAPASPSTARLVQMKAAGAQAKISTQSLRGGVSVLMGSGGNIAVLPGKDGKLLVDAGFASSQPQIAESLAVLSADPMTHLVNTHWHFDHTDGNAWMHAAGAAITAHTNTLKRLSTQQVIADYNMLVPAAPAGALPTELVDGTRTLTLNGETLHLTDFAPAHTDSDLSVHFQNADVYHAGDTWFNGLYPFIDYSTGGSIDGMIRAARVTLAATSAKTILIPGHGPVGTREELQRFHDMLAGTRENVAKLKKQGRSFDEIVAAKPTAAYDGQFKAAVGPVESYIHLVYEGV